MRVIRSAALRRVLKIGIPFVVLPVLLFLFSVVFEEKQPALLSLFFVLFALLLFAAGFEKRFVGTRRLIFVSIMTALSVTGRFLPLFKPVTALTVLTGIWLGPEAGFLCGAMSAFISNFFFGQGPWTPFQMFAWGLIGLAAGLFNTALRKSRVLLCVFGAFAGLFFSLVMDIWTVVWYAGTFSPELYLASLTSALPFTALYAASNVAFLLLFARPFGEKLARVKVKYGI